MALFDYLHSIDPALDSIAFLGLYLVYFALLAGAASFESLLDEFNIFIRVTVRLTLLVVPTWAIYLFFNGVKRFAAKPSHT